MTYDNPLRPSGLEAFDVGTVIRYKDVGHGRLYDYVGTYADNVGKHVVRDHEDGILYQTSDTGIDSFEEHVELPEKGSRWKRDSNTEVVVAGTVDFDDGVGVLVAYRFGYGDRVPFLRPLVNFLETYKLA